MISASAPAQQIVREITPSIFVPLTFTGDNYGGGSGYGFGLDQRAAEDFETDLFFFDEDSDGARSATEDVWQESGSSVDAQFDDPDDDLFDIGTDTTQEVSDGDPGSAILYDVPAPPAPFLRGFARFEKDFADPDVVATDLAIDARPDNGSATWELVVDFGFPSGANSPDITVGWDTTAIDAANAAGYNTAKIFRKSDNTELVADMSATSSLLLTGTAGRRTTLLIVLANDNVSPVARGDTVIALSSGTPTAFTIDVLANDFDPDGGTLTITNTGEAGDGSDGIVSIDSGTSLSYTPPANFVSTIGDPSTYKRFNYAIQDDNTPTPGTAMGVITVIGSDSAILATRNHADLAKAGTDADAGLAVTVEVTYSGTPTQITLVETFPSNDQTSTFYAIAPEASSGVGVSGLDVGGTDRPNTVTGNGSSTAVTFTWTTVPTTNPFSFTYRLVGDVDDRAEKTLTGSIDQDGTATNVLSKQDLTKAFTKFTAVASLGHSADFRHGFSDSPPFDGPDGLIDGGELNLVIEYFRQGYHTVTVSDSFPDGFAPGNQGTPSRGHSADFRHGFSDSPPFDGPDGFIDGGELNKFIDYFRFGYESTPISLDHPDGFRAKSP